MHQYIRYSEENHPILDYDLLNMTDRVNFWREVEIWASQNASYIENNSVVHDVIHDLVVAELKALTTDTGDKVVIDESTQQKIVDFMISILQ